MTTASLQVQLFQTLKTKLGAEVSIVDEVARILEISTDSAYRRIRGDKGLSMEELHLLCNQYHLSVDALLQMKNGVIAFEGQYVNPHAFHFKNYLAAVCQQMAYMASVQQSEMYYLCKDIPLFHHYQSKPLAAFKYFFWHKTILGSPGFDAGKLHLSDYPDDVYELGKKALKAYNSINVYEIWNSETLNSALRQVEFYHDTAAFHSNDDLLQVYEAIESLVLHLEKQAELGYQFDASDTEQKRRGEFRLYINEVMTGDNSILAVVDGVKLSFLTHSGINFMLTRNVAFCENLYQYYRSLMQKSTLISEVSERERAAFFHQLHKRIRARMKLLSS